jgi:hypothetical protein
MKNTKKRLKKTIRKRRLKEIPLKKTLKRKKVKKRIKRNPLEIDFDGSKILLPSKKHILAWESLTNSEIAIPHQVLKRTLERWRNENKPLKKETFHCQRYNQRTTPATCLGRAWFFDLTYPSCKRCEKYLTFAASCFGRLHNDGNADCKICEWSKTCFDIYRRNISNS